MRAITEPCGAVGGSLSDIKQHHEVNFRVFWACRHLSVPDLGVTSKIFVFPLLSLVGKTAPGTRSKLCALGLIVSTDKF